jgi:hypothetical protein
MIFTTECALIEIKEDKREGPMGGGMQNDVIPSFYLIKNPTKFVRFFYFTSNYLFELF